MKQRLADRISMVAQSPALDAQSIEVVVIVPTFRRPKHVITTLDSLATQATERPYAIVLVENDAEGQAGATAAAPHFEAGRYQGMAIVVHDRGNCHAYNAGFFTALTRFAALGFVCIIDDDEQAEPDWIEQMCATSEAHDAAMVGGPQLPIFEKEPSPAIVNHPVFQPHYQATGPVPALYSSGNLLLRSDVLKAMPQPFFDLRFNFTGGGDSDFLMRARQAGFSSAWCAQAGVKETIPANRTTRAWVRQRAIRNGQLSAIIEERQRGATRLGQLITGARSLGLLAASPLRSAARLFSGQSRLSALYPIHIAIGRIGSAFGQSHEQYRNPAD